MQRLNIALIRQPRSTHKDRIYAIVYVLAIVQFFINVWADAYTLQ